MTKFQSASFRRSISLILGVFSADLQHMRSHDFIFPTLVQADLKSQLGDAGYIVFGVVLFVWELLPTTLVVYFFRVRNPTKDLVSIPLSVCWCP